MKRSLAAIIAVFLLFVTYNYSVATPEPTDTRLKHVYKLTDFAGNDGFGTGFTVKYRDKIFLLTNDHVCTSRRKRKYMYAHNEKTDTWVKATIVARSKQRDLCILTGENFNTGLSLTETPAKLRDLIHIMGHPLGGRTVISIGQVYSYAEVELRAEGVYSEEECTKPSQKWVVRNLGFMVFEMCLEVRMAYSSDAQVRPGSSGSPVFNQSSKVIGIVFAGSHRTSHSSFISSEHIKIVLNNLINRQENQQYREPKVVPSQGT